ncbi:MAG: DNA alkylation repair protein [Bacteroidota bacterium]
MSARLKDIFSEDFFAFFLHEFSAIYPLDTKLFLNAVYVDSWAEKKLTDRIEHIAVSLHACLPFSYTGQIKILQKFCARTEQSLQSDWKLGYMFVPKFIELYGLNEFEVSMRAIEHITKCVSCEFAIRPFIMKYPQETLMHMYDWSNHSHQNVRRLSSEGCRPTLPWGKQIPQFMASPQMIMPILENLKTDSSVFVQKSVANNLNDISKDNPEYVLEICEKWKNTHPITAKIIKYGLRTLLKQGNERALKLCGIVASTHVSVSDFVVHTADVTKNKPLQFSCSVHNSHSKPCMIRVEYRLHFVRKNNRYTHKNFFVHEHIYAAYETKKIIKTHSFQPRTTRVYYPGKHRVELIVNGRLCGKREFYFS